MSLSQIGLERRLSIVRASVELAAKAVGEPARFDFDAIFLAHYGRITRVIARIILEPARAEELAVEAFWKLWRTPKAHGETAPGWVHRTAVRLALDELRRRARRARYERALSLIRQPRTPHELFSASEEQGRVRVVLAVMASRQAELLLLRSDGFPYDELARVLSINPASVGTLLRRARDTFRQEYVRRYGEQ
jgi:RNA polymerase sigma-70 factor (ECF subfamily)